MNDPRKWHIRASECGPGDVPTFDDVPVVGRLFQSGERGPDLMHHAALFGWDETRTKKVREMLFNLGSEVERLQDEVARVSYPGGGKVQIDYSAGSERLRNLIAEFGARLEASIGARDAARFMLLTSIPSWENERRELSVSKAPGGGNLIVKGFGRVDQVEIEGGADAGERLRIFQPIGDGDTPQRIDWQQLVREADLQASPSR